MMFDFFSSSHFLTRIMILFGKVYKMQSQMFDFFYYPNLRWVSSVFDKIQNKTKKASSV